MPANIGTRYYHFDEFGYVHFTQAGYAYYYWLFLDYDINIDLIRTYEDFSTAMEEIMEYTLS